MIQCLKLNQKDIEDILIEYVMKHHNVDRNVKCRFSYDKGETQLDPGTGVNVELEFPMEKSS